MMQCQEHKPFAGIKCFLKADPVEDQQRSGRPSATRTGDNTAQVREPVQSDQTLTVRMIADEVNMNWETIRLILAEKLGMRKICATEQKWNVQLSAVFDIPVHYGDAAASLLT
jgi:hypothetical protein